ncbi:hypothetical protein D9M68_973350 [compost metagenome]
MREDLAAAQRLLARKALLRRLEASAGREHFRRLREDRTTWIESGDLFQRMLRDYRRIHYHVTALAYPLLERSGSSSDGQPQPPAQVGKSPLASNGS